jgi:membrane protein YqaA with SNARE-associated domain
MLTSGWQRKPGCLQADQTPWILPCGGLALSAAMTKCMDTLLLSSRSWIAGLGGSAGALIASLGGVGVMCLAIADSSFLSLPEGNDLLIVMLSIGNSWETMAYYVGMTVTGSVLGCMLLYFLGRKGGSSVLRRKFSPQKIDRAEKLFARYGILTVLIPSILPPPLPFKIFVLSAGVFRLRVPVFMTAVIIGRTLRYSMWGILAVIYGETVKQYIQENLNIVGVVLLSCFVVVLTICLFYYFHRLKVHGNSN